MNEQIGRLMKGEREVLSKHVLSLLYVLKYCNILVACFLWISRTQMKMRVKTITTMPVILPNRWRKMQQYVSAAVNMYIGP